MEHLENTQQMRPLCQKMIDKLSSIIRNTDFLDVESKELMWKKVIKVANDNFFVECFGDVIEQCSCEKDAAVVRGLAFFAMPRIIKELFALSNEIKGTSKLKEVILSEKEQQSLYYVGGYIVHSFIKKYKKLAENPKNVAAQDALTFFLSLKSHGSETFPNHSFLSYVEKWVDLENRGGLVKVNEDFIIFVRRIETVTQSLFTVEFMRSYKGQDIKEILMERLNESSLIQLGWESLVRELPNRNLSKLLFTQILEKWTDIRANGYVK